MNSRGRDLQRVQWKTKGLVVEGEVPDGLARYALEVEQEDGGDAKGSLQRNNSGRAPVEITMGDDKDAAHVDENGDFEEGEDDGVEDAKDKDQLDDMRLLSLTRPSCNSFCPD